MEQEVYYLIRLGPRDQGPRYLAGAGEGGGRPLWAFTDSEVAETHLRLNGLGVGDGDLRAWVVGMPWPVVEAIADGSPGFAGVEVDPPLTAAQLLQEVVDTQRHCRALERRLEALERVWRDELDR